MKKQTIKEGLNAASSIYFMSDGASDTSYRECVIACPAEEFINIVLVTQDTAIQLLDSKVLNEKLLDIVIQETVKELELEKI